MRIIGHEKQREELERTAARAVLLRGPSGVGKWAVADAHADAHGGAVSSLRDGPTVEQARQVESLYSQRALGGRFTVTLVDLDRSSRAIQNTLLKTIEEMPEWGQVVMVASQPVLPTILSRSQVLSFAPLSDDQVAEVLVQQNVSPASAGFLAKMSGGSVEKALEFQEAVVAKPVVMQYLDAIHRHDRVAITTMMPRWTEGARVLFWRWVTEVLADWPRVFTKAELSVVHKIGVGVFYKLVELMRAGVPPDLAAYEVWR